MTQSTSSVLAAYATIKSLSDENKYQSPYQILREFIRYIIKEDTLYGFSSAEMKNLLSNHFGFSIPEAVIRTSIKNMAGVSLDHGVYSVNPNELGTDSLFEDKKKEADEYESCIIRMLSEYISEKTGKTKIDENLLVRDFTLFLTDDCSHTTQYTDLIGEFILKNEHNHEIQTGLNKIREGSILYVGISHNIGELGSITKPLTLYLGTEILFSLAGYNGVIHQQLANDFYDQVRAANIGKPSKITLRYFSDIKKEIDEFFGTASEIVEGKRSRLLDKPAMKAITDGCSTLADVAVKKADFYHLMQFGFGIQEDTHDDYYDEEYFSSNLESFEYEDEADKKKKKELAIKLISHINKLRGGNRYNGDIDSEHLIVTNTKATLLIAKEQVAKIKEAEGLEYLCNFAVSLEKITSLLWYKLGNGFNQKAYPTSISAVLKARIVLSASIAKKAEKAFSAVKKRFENHELTEDQVAARIIMLRKKPTLPEDLQGDDITEIMDFSPEYLSRYEEQFKQNQNDLKEKDVLIETLKADSQKVISEKDATIASQEGIIKQKDDENAELRGKLKEYQHTNAENTELRGQLEEYRRKEGEVARKKERRKNKWKLAWHIFWRISIIAIFTAIVIVCEKRFNFTIPAPVYTAVNALGLLALFWKDIRETWKKYLPKPDSTENKDS